MAITTAALVLLAPNNPKEVWNRPDSRLRKSRVQKEEAANELRPKL